MTDSFSEVECASKDHRDEFAHVGCPEGTNGFSSKYKYQRKRGIDQEEVVLALKASLGQEKGGQGRAKGGSKGNNGQENHIKIHK